MKESHREDIAYYSGLELYAGGDKVMGVTKTEVCAGELTSPKSTIPGVETVMSAGRQYLGSRHGERRKGTQFVSTRSVAGPK